MKNLHVKISAALLFTLISGCAPNENESITIAKTVVKDNLKDPDSAKFGNIHLIKHSPDANGIQKIYACGVVDGKNSYSAYTGGTRFVVGLLSSGSETMQTISFLEIDDKSNKAVPYSINKEPATRFEHIYWNVYCLDSTHAPTFTGAR